MNDSATTLEEARSSVGGERLGQRPGLVASTLGVAKKDLLIEWRGRARINATLFFGVLTLLLFSFAIGPDSKMLARTAGGFLWLAILLSSIMSLSESMRIEIENNALEGLRLLPVEPIALFFGKAVVNTVYLFVLSLLLVPLMAALYGVSFEMGVLRLVGILFLGSAAISAPGTLYAAMTVQAKGKDVLLPLLLFPILVPALLGAVKATSLVITGDPMEQIEGWSILLGGFSVAYWCLCSVLFGRVIED